MQSCHTLRYHLTPPCTCPPVVRFSVGMQRCHLVPTHTAKLCHSVFKPRPLSSRRLSQLRRAPEGAPALAARVLARKAGLTPPRACNCTARSTGQEEIEWHFTQASLSMPA